MAGDWIKMRGNLWDDPRVGSLCDATEQGEAAIVGGLFWLWSTADQHTEDGFMSGLTLRQIDRKTGIQGFGAALVAIGWVAEVDGGILIAKFDEHNGASAKRRSMDAQRKANGRKVSASEADNVRTELGDAAEHLRRIAELEKELEEEKRKKDSGDKSPSSSATEIRPEVAVCIALRKAGVAAVSADHPRLVALVAAGATPGEFLGFLDAANRAQVSDPFAYVLKAVENERTKARGMADKLHQGAMPVSESAYAKSQREKYEQLVPGLAAKRPGASPFTIDMEPINGTPLALG